jgi:hypothetical protein
VLRLKTFGGLWLEGDEGRLTGAAGQRRRLVLLAALAAPVVVAAFANWLSGPSRRHGGSVTNVAFGVTRHACRPDGTPARIRTGSFRALVDRCAVTLRPARRIPQLSRL